MRLILFLVMHRDSDNSDDLEVHHWAGNFPMSFTPSPDAAHKRVLPIPSMLVSGLVCACISC